MQRLRRKSRYILFCLRSGFHFQIWSASIDRQNVANPTQSCDLQSFLLNGSLKTLSFCLQLFANLRPVKAYPALASFTPLRPELLDGVDLLIVRELTGGLYFGPQQEQGDGDVAYDTDIYTAGEAVRWLRTQGQALNKQGIPWLLVVSFISPHDIMYADVNQPGEVVQKSLTGRITRPPDNSAFSTRWKFPPSPSALESLDKPGRPRAQLLASGVAMPWALDAQRMLGEEWGFPTLLTH